MPNRFIVTSHSGTVTWMARKGIEADKVVMGDFDVAAVQPGDIVIGTLPLHLAAEVIRKGGRYWNFVLVKPEALRDKRDLAVQEIEQCQPRLEEFRISSAGVRAAGQADPLAPYQDLPVTMFCIASGQILPNLLPLAQRRCNYLFIYATTPMSAVANKLRQIGTDVCGDADKVKIVPLPDNADFMQLRSFVQAHIAGLDDDPQLRRSAWVVNVTGGMKIHSLACVDAFRSRAEIIYCDSERGCLDIIDPPGRHAEVLRVDALNLPGYLEAHGLKLLRGVKPGSDVANEAAARSALTATLCMDKAMMRRRDPGLKTDMRSYLHLLGSSARDWPDVADDERRQVSLPTPVFLPDLEALRPHLEAAGLIDHWDVTGANVTVGVTNRDSGVYLAGGYLEELVFQAASSLGLADDMVGMSVVVAPGEASAPERSTNELDVVIVCRGRMLVIECKAGNRLGEKAQDITNKLDALQRRVGGALGRGWIVTMRKLDPSWDIDLIQRSASQKLELVMGHDGLQQLPQLLATHFGLGLPTFVWPPEGLIVRWPPRR